MPPEYRVPDSPPPFEDVPVQPPGVPGTYVPTKVVVPPPPELGIFHKYGAPPETLKSSDEPAPICWPPEHTSPLRELRVPRNEEKRLDPPVEPGLEHEPPIPSGGNESPPDYPLQPPVVVTPPPTTPGPIPMIPLYPDREVDFYWN